MSTKTHESAELTKVGGVGFLGWLASLTLSDVATLVSIAVGLATLTYVLSKTYFLYKNHGKTVE